MWNKIKHYLYLIFIKYFGLVMILLLTLDLVTKVVMENILKTEGSVIPLIPNLFEFQLVYNKGAFSGWFGGDVGHIILIIISFLGAVILPYIFIKNRNKYNLGMNIALALIIPGDIGNLIDRIIYVGGKPRGVIDFLHFYIPAINFDWPVFNVADTCLVVGVILFAVAYFIYDSKIEKEKKLAQEKLYEEAKKKQVEAKENQDGE